ncbi:hypothetical protein [Cobetia sp. L2A1]|uniref:hypothetical protein n=1 Tax=Cobetia sp. L2A1 TaxID=2686360 RepID=UPI00131DB468|nr:hypothetical protein [Cobetia sp. L2A1]
MSNVNDRIWRTVRAPHVMTALVGVLLLGVSSLASSAGLAIKEDFEAETTGTIESLEDNMLMVGDAGFEMVPSSRVLTRNGRELKSFHLDEGQEVEIHFDPRYEPRRVIDIILLRRGG